MAEVSIEQENWHPTACNLCYANCGILVKTDNDSKSIVKVKGDFVWHNHSDTDEFFFVIEGTLFIEFEYKTMQLDAGELNVVPQGIQHRPYAKEECKVLLIEPRGVVNTGESDSELTASNDVWV